MSPVGFWSDDDVKLGASGNLGVSSRKKIIKLRLRQNDEEIIWRDNEAPGLSVIGYDIYK